MTTGYICDRCGETFTDGGRWLQGVYNGSTAILERWDLCPECMEGLTAWMNCGQESQDVTGDVERVTDEGEMSHDTREQLELDVSAYLINVCTWERQRYELRVEVERWLDRQASITQAECERICDTCDWPSLAAQPDQEAYDRIAELEAQLADAREALDMVWSERDQWRDAYMDSERMRLELVEELEKRDKGIRRLKQRRGELMEQVRRLQDDAARGRREA